ncbi:MAG: DUF4830 domain-containing protein [Oscillospiraceae bacterium]|nr:DUF4830 domain-containing protein [Oscillospiraceae bacterium]
MMVMTAKVNFKKILLSLVALAGVILAAVMLFGNSDEPTSAAAVSTNDSRVQFLKDFGWEVSSSPVESSQVRIPETQSEVFSRYNDLQKSQGYDLSQFAGKAAMRYVYKVNNFPEATEPVYATVLVYKNQVIGGDITDTAAKGVIQGFQKREALPEATIPTEATTPSVTE